VGGRVIAAGFLDPPFFGYTSILFSKLPSMVQGHLTIGRGQSLVSNWGNAIKTWHTWTNGTL